MATSKVQSAIATPASGVTTIAKAFAGAVTAGNTLFAAVTAWKSGGSTITQVRDSVNGAFNWTLIKSMVQTTDTETVALYMWANTAGGTPTVTATFPSAHDACMEIWEESGLGTSPVQDGTPVAGLNASTTAHISPNLVTSLTSTIFGVYGDAGYNTTIVPGGTWTDEVKSSGSAIEQNAVESKGQGAGVGAATYAAAFTTGVAAPSVCICAAFQNAGGAAATFPPVPRRKYGQTLAAILRR